MIMYHESVIARESGYTSQALYAMRTGQRVGKYVYPPTLERGTHWDKMGGAVIYTEAGRDEVLKRAEKRKARQNG